MPTRRERLYHLALQEDWETARAGDSGYRTSTLGEDLADVGFIHCGYARQIRRIADQIYRDRHDVLLLTIDPTVLRSRVVDEPAEVTPAGEDSGAGDGGVEEFPHVYGPIDLDAVTDVRPLELRSDGTLEVEIEGAAEQG